MKHIKLFTIFVFIGFFMAACGGGGDGGGESAVTYTGKTTQAEVTTANSGKLASEVQEFGGGLDDAAFPLKPGGHPRQTHLQAVHVIQWLESSVLNERGLLSANKPVQVDPPLSENGNCGGNFVATGTIDDVTLDFDLTIRFNNYCNNGTTVSGAITATGSATVFGDINISNMTMENLTVQDSVSSFSMNGSLVVHSQSVSSSDITMNMMIRNNASGKTVKIENYRVTETNVPGGIRTSISGRFFSPDEGFVDVSTPTPFFTAFGNTFPSSGVLEITGSNGAKAQLTALDASQFRLEVDADANGTFESTTTELWENLETVTF
ncbi:MAG: hypothetical protein ACE5F7_09115 [Nitrospiria bacterium]